MSDSSPPPSIANRITVIECSLRCFALSVPSLIPILGLPLALAAFSNFRRARSTSRGAWNPARKYLLWGSILSSLGLLLSLGILLIAACAFLQLLPGQYSG